MFKLVEAEFNLFLEGGEGNNVQKANAFALGEEEEGLVFFELLKRVLFTTLKIVVEELNKFYRVIFEILH